MTRLKKGKKPGDGGNPKDKRTSFHILEIVREKTP